MKLSEVTKVERGKNTDVFRRNTAKAENEKLCFSLIGGDRTLDLVAESEQQREEVSFLLPALLFVVCLFVCLFICLLACLS